MFAGVNRLDVREGFGHAAGRKAFVFALGVALRSKVAAHGV